MNRRLFFILFLSVISLQIRAQVNSYFVRFTDKENTPYSVNAPEFFLTQRAIDRRTNQGIIVTEDDLPPTPTYLISLENTGSVSVRYVSRWFNGAIIQATSVDAELVKQLSFVADIEYIAPSNAGGRAYGGSKFDSLEQPASDSLSQFSILGIDEMRGDGIDGTGKMIAVLDGGFRGVDTGIAFGHLFNNNQLISTYDFITGTNNVFQHSSHGTKVLSLMAAAQTSPEYVGIAPGASYLLYITENADNNIEYRIEEYWWLIAAEKADSLGADVINTSLGYYSFEDPSMDYTHDDLNGRTAVITLAAQKAAERGIVFVTSAGNTGNKTWEKITFPGDIVDGLAVGSMVNEITISSFSASGPSIDDRIKPDVMAIGSSVYVITEDGRIIRGSGTSYSSPMIAALAAGFWQANPELTALEILDAFRFSSTNSISPDNEIGYGIPSYRALKNYVEHLKAETWASIYPNPTERELLVYVNDPSEDPLVNIKLYNCNGQPLLFSSLDITWHDNKYILDVSTLPQGIYVLNLQSNNNTSQLKFVKL